MKKLLWGVLGALCILIAGCEMEIPTDEVTGKLNISAFCILSGGVFEGGRCHCGEEGELVECGENVTCSIDEKTGRKACAGMAYTLLPSGPCSMEGVISCANRINSKGVSIGYATQCENNAWTEVAPCEKNYSCMIYEFRPGIMSSKCGNCQDNGEDCVAGEVITQN